MDLSAQQITSGTNRMDGSQRKPQPQRSHLKKRPTSEASESVSTIHSPRSLGRTTRHLDTRQECAVSTMSNTLAVEVEADHVVVCFFCRTLA